MTGERRERLGRGYRRFFPTARTVLLHRDLAALPLERFRRILVIGAGADPYASRFREAELYVRSDLRISRGITDALADAHRLPFADASFDCVFASEVVEHLEEPWVFAREAVRVLQPLGTIVVTVPFLFHSHGDPYDFWRPTRQTCRDLFQGCDVVVRGQGNRLHVISDLITTAGSPWPPLMPLRVLNHLFRFLPSPAEGSRSTAPNGFCVVATRID